VTEPLFDHLREVARAIDDLHLLVGLDFDGTVAPIVADPAEAHIPEEGQGALDTLTSRPGTTVAIVSGRALEDLRSRVGANVILAGNHGLEIIENGTQWTLPEAEKWRPHLKEICGELASSLRWIPGAAVEDKGLTASVHYRRAAPGNVGRIADLVSATVAANREYFFMRRGKKVFEILPRTPWNKGSAMLRIRERLRETEGREISVCYIGDDLTDELAFRVLTRAITVRVGPGGSTAARFNVPDTTAVYEFLRWLAAGNGNPAEGGS
jgi:trehalose 6-phosphate phosphatase